MVGGDDRGDPNSMAVGCRCQTSWAAPSSAASPHPSNAASMVVGSAATRTVATTEASVRGPNPGPVAPSRLPGPSLVRDMALVLGARPGLCLA